MHLLEKKPASMHLTPLARGFVTSPNLKFRSKRTECGLKTRWGISHFSQVDKQGHIFPEGESPFLWPCCLKAAGTFEYLVQMCMQLEAHHRLCPTYIPLFGERLLQGNTCPKYGSVAWKHPQRNMHGLMTGHVFRSCLGDFPSTECWGGRARSHPKPCPLLRLAKRGLREYTKALRMLQCPSICMLYKDSTEHPMYPLETVSSCQSAVYSLDLWESWLYTGRVAGEGIWCSTTCVNVGWHHLCTINIPIG